MAGGPRSLEHRTQIGIDGPAIRPETQKQLQSQPGTRRGSRRGATGQQINFSGRLILSCFGRGSTQQLSRHTAVSASGSNWALLLVLILIGLCTVKANLPPSPATLEVTAVLETQVTLTWPAVGAAEAYRILFSHDQAGTFEPLLDVYASPFREPPNVANVTDLVEGKIYYLKVSSGLADGQFNTETSSLAVGTPLGPPTNPVTGLAVIGYDSTQVKLSWDPPGASADSGPAPTHYAVFYDCGAAVTLSLYPEDFTSTTVFVAPAGGFSVGTETCRFEVASRNLNYIAGDPWNTAGNKNQRSSQISKFLEEAPGSPSALTVTDADLSSLTISWTAALRAISYRVSYAAISADGSVGTSTVFSEGTAATAMVVSGLTLGQLYRVTVQATNLHLSGYETGVFIDVRVEGPPAAPVLRIDSVQATQVQVSWDPPSSTQPLEYEIVYIQGGNTVTFPTTTSVVAVVQPLTEGVEVTIKVRAQNLYAFGDYGNISVTPLAAPTVATENVTAIRQPGFGEQSILVSWVAVPLVDRYKIQLSVEEGSFAETGIEVAETSALVTGLTASTNYTFKVFSGNIAGFESTGTVSNMVATDYVDQPNSTVNNLVVIGVTTTSIQLGWDRPHSSQKVTAYRIIQIGGPTAEVLVSSEEPTFNATGLLKEAPYSFLVTPRSANGRGYEGIPNATVSGKTVFPPTTIVTNVRVTRITDVSVFISWTPIQSIDIFMYRVEGSTANVSIPSVEVSHPAELSQDIEVEYPGLSPGLDYDFLITARTLNTIAYEGVPSATLSGVQIIGLPAAVSNFRITNLTKSSVSLKWDVSSLFPIASIFRIVWRTGLVPFSDNGFPPTSNNEATITGLLRGASFDFKVFAGTLAGYELNGSQVVSAIPISRPQPVEALRIIEIGDTTISFEWDPPFFPAPTSYLLKVANLEFETTETRFQATGLTPGVTVTVTVFTRNYNTLGYEQMGRSAVVTPIQPPKMVTTLEVASVTTTTVSLYYDPAELANVTRHKVQVKRSTSSVFEDYAEYVCRIDEQFLESEPLCSTAITVSGLVLGVEYNFRVLQRNSNNLGYQIGGTIVTTRPIFKPTQSVSSLAVTGVTTSAVFLSFQPPTEIDAPTHYKIVYSETNSTGAESETPEFPLSLISTANVSGLTQDVRYQFQVIGRNLNTDGYTGAVRSQPVVTAPIQRPVAVTNLQVTGVAANAIEIAWDPPPGSVVELYEVGITDKTILVSGNRLDITELGIVPIYYIVGTTTATTFKSETSSGFTIVENLPVILRVRARNLNIEGLGDPAYIVATPTPAPSVEPQDFKVVSVNANSVFLSWMPPTGTAAEASVTRYKVEICPENCGSDAAFPPAPALGTKHYISGGAEYEWTGSAWEATGVTFWTTLAIVPYTTLTYNATHMSGARLQTNEDYDFRVSAGNLNTESFGPSANLIAIQPVLPPGPAREVIISNAQNSLFALNFIAPLVTNTTGPASFYRLLVMDLTSSVEYDYFELLTTTASVVTGFLPGTTYRVRVFPGNLGGFDTSGTRSTSTVTTTANPCTQDCCPGGTGCDECCGLFIRKSRQTSTNVGEMEIIWEAPQNLDLLHFKVDYRRTGFQTPFEGEQIVLGNRVIITGLSWIVSSYDVRIIGGQLPSNSFDTETYAYTLVAPTLPDAATFEVSIVSFTRNTALVQWTKPYADTLRYEMLYAIEISVDNFGESSLNNTRVIWPIQEPPTVTTMSYNIDNLRENEIVSIRVLAKTPFEVEYKFGIPSNTIIIKPQAQPPAVTNLRISSVGADFVFLSWDQDPEAFVVEYEITWSPGRTVIIPTPSPTLETNVSNLITDNVYTFTVRSRNLNSFGFGDAVSVVGGPSGIPAPPLFPRLIQYYVDGVEMSWTAPTMAPFPVQYEIQCRSVLDPATDSVLNAASLCRSGPSTTGAPFIAAMRVDDTKRFARITGIAENREYHFRVCSVGTNIAGVVEATCSDYFSVVTGGPPSPVTASVSSVTTTSITLGWSPALNSGELWSFVPGKDQPGFDLRCFPGANVSALQAECENDGSCEGFSTNGCLKSRIGFEDEWLDYSVGPFALGQCCLGVGNPFSCATAGQEINPKPSCGCECRGLWKKNLQYLLQMSAVPEPFANLYVSEAKDRFGTRVSRPAGCTDCAACPSGCVTVTGLTLNSEYQFRVFARSLNGLGYAADSSNIASGVPRNQPSTSVSDLSVSYTLSNRVQLVWTGISGAVTAYRLQVSLDNSIWYSDSELNGILLDEAAHQSGQLTGGASVLTSGTLYYFRVQARNLNSDAYNGVPGSNVVSGTPFPTIDPVTNLAVTAVSACTSSSCGCACCGSNLCRGIGTVTLSWTVPTGPITQYRVNLATVNPSDASVGAYSIHSDQVSSAASTFEVTGLSIGTLFSFQVQAGSKNLVPYQDAGILAVQASPYIQPTTSVQSSLESVHVTAESVTLRWRTIDSEPVTRYQVAYGTNILNPTEIIYAEVDHQNYSKTFQIEGLSTGEAYFFSIIPRNLNSAGYKSCPTSADSVSWTSLGDGDFRITWSHPTWDVIIPNYQIWYQRNDLQQIFPVLYHTFNVRSTYTTLSYTVTGLSPTANYTFYVTPDAPPCATIGPLMPLETPQIVASFGPSNADPTSIKFTWAPAPEVGGIRLVDEYVLSRTATGNETSFDVGCANLGPNNFTNETVIVSTQSHFTFQGLEPFQPYCFKIQGRNSNQHPIGPPSTFFSIPVPLPSLTPNNVNIVSRSNVAGEANGASITLSWTAPSVPEGSGPVDRFRIAYWPASVPECLQKDPYVSCQNYTEFNAEFSQTSGTVNGLQPARTYYFKVYSGNVNGFETVGSANAGPFETSRLPGPVQGLDITTITSSSITLTWALPSDPAPSKLKLQYVDLSNGDLVVEEQSCQPPVNACPTSKVWSSLAVEKEYTFTVFTGGPNDALVGLTEEEEYSGIAAINGRLYEVSDAPPNFQIVSWTDSSVYMTFDLPVATLAKGPVLRLYIEGKIGSGSYMTTDLGSVLQPDIQAVGLTVKSIGGISLALYNGTSDTEYAFRLIASNANGNSTASEIGNVRLFPVPSQVPSLQKQLDVSSATSCPLTWTKPSAGTDAGSGFMYMLEVSDDGGVHYFQDLHSPFSDSSNSTTVEYVNRPVPQRLAYGKGYVARIRGKNLHSSQFGPVTSLWMYPVIPPSAARSLSIYSQTSTEIMIQWDSPIEALLTSPSSYKVTYVLEVAQRSESPTFLDLGPPFSNISTTYYVLTWQELQRALSDQGHNLPVSNKEFFVRIIARNVAGKSLDAAPYELMVFTDLPSVRIEDFTVSNMIVDSAILSWKQVNDTSMLTDLRIRYSTDGAKFQESIFLPLDRPVPTENGFLPTQHTIEKLDHGQVWFEIVQIGYSGASIRPVYYGPLTVPALIAAVDNLVVESVSMSSAFVRWSLPDSPVLNFEVTVSTSDGNLVGTFLTLQSFYNATNLITGISYSISVVSLTLGGRSESATVEIAPEALPAAVSALKVTSVTASSVTLTWSVVVNPPSPVTYIVEYGELNADGGVASLTKFENPTDGMAVIGDLKSTSTYRYQVRVQSLHQELGYSSSVDYRITNLPVAPGNFSVAFSRPAALAVKWDEPPAGQPVILYYKIETTGASVPAASVSIRFAPNIFYAEVQELQPAASHTVTIYACNEAGCTGADPLTNVYTAPGQPVNTITTALTANSFSLHWTPPSPSLPYTYRLRYRTITTTALTFFVSEGQFILTNGGSTADLIFSTWSAYTSTNNGGQHPNVTISGLVKNFVYQVAITVTYQGIDSDPYYYVGLPADPPEQVLAFGVSDDAHNGVLNDTITVQWDPPTGSVVTEYRLDYYASGDVANTISRTIGYLEANELANGAGTNYFTVTGLTLYQPYYFLVTAINLAGQGTQSGIALNAVPAPIPVQQPGRVQNLRLTGATVNTVDLAWDPPPGEDSAFYNQMQYLIFQAQVVNGVPQAWSVIAQVSTTTYTVSLLTLGNEYQFEVQSRNSNSQGYSTGRFINGGPVTPCNAAACIVRSLAVCAYSATSGGADVSITLFWDEPSESETDTLDEYFYKVEYISGSTVTLAQDLDKPYFTITTHNGASLAVDTAYTYRVYARNLRNDNYGASNEIVATARTQPTRLTTAPTVSQVAPTSVTLSWTEGSPAGEYSYKIGYRAAGTDNAFDNPTYTTTNTGTVTGLTLGASYEFKVFQRNLNDNGFEGLGSDVVTGIPRNPLGPPRDFRLTAVTETTIDLAWSSPADNVAVAQYKLIMGTAASDPNNSTLVNSVNAFTYSVTGLTLGSVYFFQVEAKDIGGWSAVASTKGRPFGKATAVINPSALAKDAENIGLSWEAPTTLAAGISSGLTISHYVVEVGMPLGSSSYTFQQLGTSTTNRFLHDGLTVKNVNLYYNIYAMIEQSADFGFVHNPGTASTVNLFFGTAPSFTNSTPSDGSTVVVDRYLGLIIPFEAYSPDVPTVSISFQATGSLPPNMEFQPAVARVDVMNKLVSQNISVEYFADIAGSEFYICFEGVDSNGLRTQTRCLTIIVPEPRPVFLAPPQESIFEARVGCTLTINILAEDRTSANLATDLAASAGFIPEPAIVSVTRTSAYDSQVTSALPDGAQLTFTDTGVVNPRASILQWIPLKGQEGFQYRICVQSLDSSEVSVPLCVNVVLVRCEACARTADSLQTISRQWHTSWTEVWSGNQLLQNPDLVIEEQTLSLGPVYVVTPGEDLEHIALRYGVSSEDLLWWNPDIASTASESSDYRLQENQEICVVPQSCVYGASISSSYSIATL